MTDTRIFKISWSSGRIKYGDRNTVARIVPRHKHGLENGWLNVLATNNDATDGWSDVTPEFRARYVG